MTMQRKSKTLPFWVFTWDASLVGDFETENEAVEMKEKYGGDVVTTDTGTILRWSSRVTRVKDKNETAKRLADWFRVFLKPEVIAPDYLQTYLIEQHQKLFEQCRAAQRTARFMEHCGRSVGDIADKLEFENKQLHKTIMELKSELAAYKSRNGS